MPNCITCGKETEASCTRCKKANFCDKKCLEIVWSEHKKDCQKNITISDVSDNKVFVEYIKNHNQSWIEGCKAISKGETKDKILLFKGDSFFVNKIDDLSKILVKDVYKRFKNNIALFLDPKSKNTDLDILVVLKGRNYTIIQV